MKTSIAFITFILATQAPAQRYGRYDRNDTYPGETRDAIDRLTKEQAATTKAVEAARVQAEDDAQRARSRAGFAELEAKLEAAHQQRAARADAALESTYVPRPATAAAPATSSVYTPGPVTYKASADTMLLQKKEDVRPLDETMVLISAILINNIRNASNLTVAEKQREVEAILHTIRMASLHTPK